MERLAVTNTLAEIESLAKIDDREGYSRAGEYVKSIRNMCKMIEEEYDPEIKAAFSVHRTKVAEKNSELEPLKSAEKRLQAEMIRYDNWQEQLRRESERRRLAEAQAAEEARRMAEAERVMELAEETHFDPQPAVEEILSAPIEVVIVAPVKETPKVEGISYREVWKYRITDANIVPREYLIVDDKLISAVLRVKKGETSIPGVEVYAEKIQSVRS